MKTFIYLLCSLWLSFAVHAAELKFEPATPIVEVGKKVTLTVSGGTEPLAWSAQKGWVIGVGTEVNYEAPDQTGFDVVTVLDADGNIGTVKVQIVGESNISVENAVWDVFINRNSIQALLLSEDEKTLWVGTTGGLEKRDAKTGEIQQVFLNTDGLPDNTVYALLSDGQGGIWVGTNGGLAHYTAQGEWQVFNPDNSGLPSYSVLSLLSDGQGGLWVGTWRELAHYTAQGEWQTFNTENSAVPGNFINALLSDGQGGIWVGTDGGLAHRNAQGEWQVFNVENSGLPDNHVYFLLSDGQGGIWVGTYEDLAHYTAQGEWQVFNTENSRLPSNSVSSLLSDGQGGVWVGTYESVLGIGTNTGGTGGLVHYTAQGEWQVFNTRNSGLPSDWVSSLLNDGQGGLWVGTQEGLAHYSTQGIWQMFINVENSGLLSNEVYSLLSDGQGGVWVGTMGGLAHYTAQGEWQTFNTENLGLLHNKVYSLLNDGQGGLWVGTQEGLAYCTDQGEWQIFNIDNSDLPSNVVFSLLNDSQGGLWIGTGSGLAHYTAQGEWQVFNVENSGLLSNGVYSLLSDGQGGLWVGTWEGGLTHYTVQGEWQWQTFDTGYVLSLLNDSQGGLWVGTFQGLEHYTAQGEWQIFNTENSDLPSNLIYSLLSDGQGGLWVGASQGEWQIFNTENSGLPSNLVYSLLSDGQGGVWVGTSQGLAHYTIQGEWQIFNTENSGLPSNSVWSFLNDGQGGWWVGTLGGLAHLTFPEKQSGNRAAMIIAAGGNHSKNTLWDATESVTNYIYKMLAARKFVNEEIYYLSSKDWADFNGDGLDDRIVDAPKPERPLNLDDIRQAFAWATERGKLDQPLYVFFMDHGGNEKLFLDTDETVIMQATELKTILDNYQAVTGNQVVLVIEACYSGSHLPILAAPNRAIITSASSDEVAYFNGKQGFTRFFTKYLFSGANFKEAYELAQRDQSKMLGKLDQRTVASEATETAKTTQSPQLDDTGDGIYDPAQDGQWLKQVRINGDLVTADFTLTVENLTTITTASVGQPVILQAKTIAANDNAERVWAVIRPPRMHHVIDTNGTPILAFPRVYLAKKEADLWQTSWQDAIYNGDYEITFYAEDKQGNIAGSELDTVLTVSGGVDPPDSANVQILLEKEHYQRGELFKAELIENLGWGFDLYAAVVMPDGNFLALKNTNEPRAVNEAKPWYGQRQQNQPIILFELTLPTDLPTGHYCLYGILSPEQADVFETLEKGLWVYTQQCFEVF